MARSTVESNLQARARQLMAPMSLALDLLDSLSLSSLEYIGSRVSIYPLRCRPCYSLPRGIQGQGRVHRRACTRRTRKRGTRRMGGKRERDGRVKDCKKDIGRRGREFYKWTRVLAYLLRTTPRLFVCCFIFCCVYFCVSFSLSRGLP